MTIFQRLMNWLSMAFAVCLVVSAMIFAYILLTPIDVVTDWKLHVDPGTYHTGDEIVVHASYKKLKDVSGTAYYYLECKTERGSLARYPLSQTEGNRARGTGEIDTQLHLPSDLPGLPTECRIFVSVDYTIYTFRKFVENNASNYFEVKE